MTITMRDIETLTSALAALGVVVMAGVLISLGVICIRLVLADGPGICRTGGALSLSVGWPLEDLEIGLADVGGVVRQVVRTTWPEAARWASETSRRPDVLATWVLMPGAGGAVSWTWQAGVQVGRTVTGVA